MEDLTYCSHCIDQAGNKSQLRTSKGISPCFLHMGKTDGDNQCSSVFRKMCCPVFCLSIALESCQAIHFPPLVQSLLWKDVAGF